MSAGAGERFLTCVRDEERQQLKATRDRVTRELEKLKTAPPANDAEKRYKDLAASLPGEPRIFALWDRGEPSPTYIYRRGDYQNAGALAQPGVAGGAGPILAPSTKSRRRAPGAKSTGRRLAFARWLVAPQHPLTARVMINRIWKHHFGQGLVKSLGNFGHTGDRPSHPELLNWLACEFQRQGWSMKAMHRLMMTSSTYRQSSVVVPAAADADPDNRFAVADAAAPS